MLNAKAARDDISFTTSKLDEKFFGESSHRKLPFHKQGVTFGFEVDKKGPKNPYNFLFFWYNRIYET